MASHIDIEMNTYLTEIEKLQAKVTELQKEKELMENQKELMKKQKEEKTTEIEPNLAVMEKWLDSVIGERKNTKRAKKYYESLYDNTKDISLKTRQEIWKLRRVYYNNSLDKWMPPNQEPLFHNTNHKSPDTVSQFMIDYIEATRNLFKIQQKQINELKVAVAKME
tara:strand:+ start:2316 stop:2813 length:498 start_codon:yes stop_codon:yes gene_type:complete